MALQSSVSPFKVRAVAASSPHAHLLHRAVQAAFAVQHTRNSKLPSPQTTRKAPNTTARNCLRVMCGRCITWRRPRSPSRRAARAGGDAAPRMQITSHATLQLASRT
jgi:hypothetical protein